ncbi:MAG: ATP synthase F0 subunit B [Deltaproteobacteria bacterium]|nr:ATP synthase F0 subunit B [Deltaproteobacteria bacterium]
MSRLSLKHLLIGFVALNVVLFVVLIKIFGLDTEGSLWTNLMMWVNFFFLVLLFWRFGKDPLVNFLCDEAEKIKGDISLADKNLRDARALMDSEADTLKSMDDHILKIRENIIRVAKKEKENILEQAKINADKMIENARQESEYRVALARKQLSEDMLDMAIAIAVNKLQKILGRKDNEKIIDKFTSELGSSNFSL